MPVQNGMITFRTGICRFFTILFPETDEFSVLKFPELLLFQAFINIGYITFIVPFRFLRIAGREYTIKTNVVQQVISTVLVLCATIYSLLSTRLLFHLDLKRNPSEAFAVIFGMMKKSFIVVWFYTFWLCRENFHKFLMVCQHDTIQPSMHLGKAVATTMLPSAAVADGDGSRRNSVNWKLALASRLIVLFATGKLVLETCHTYWIWDPHSKKPYKAEDKNLEFFDYLLNASYVVGWKSFHLDAIMKRAPMVENLFRQEYILRSIITLVFMLLGVIQDYVCNMIDAFCFIGAAIICSVCWRFTEEIPKMKSKSSEIHIKEPNRFLKVLEKMSIEFTDLTTVVETTNDIFGPMFLMYIMGAFPSLGGFMMFKQISPVTGVPLGIIAIATSVSMHVLVSMVASEGSSKMGDYKAWLFDASLLRKSPTVWKTDSSAERVPTSTNAILSRLNHLHREVSSDIIGLKGCGFFTMTHGLIGTLLGIFVTFAIVIVQFEMDTSAK